jgi:DNA-binding MarR family transcriptional regulator
MVDDQDGGSPGPVREVGPISHAIFRVARLHKMFAGQLLRETGLFPGQELLMMRLWDDGPQRQVDLVRTLDSDAPTMARSIQRLERAGFVRRSPNPADGRSMLIEATPASMSLRRSVERIWAELEALTVGGMTDGEQAAALAALGTLERQLQAADRARSADD